MGVIREYVRARVIDEKMFREWEGQRKISRIADLTCMGIKAKIKKNNFVDRKKYYTRLDCTVMSTH